MEDCNLPEDAGVDVADQPGDCVAGCSACPRRLQNEDADSAGDPLIRRWLSPAISAALTSHDPAIRSRVAAFLASAAGARTPLRIAGARGLQMAMEITRPLDAEPEPASNEDLGRVDLPVNASSQPDFGPSSCGALAVFRLLRAFTEIPHVPCSEVQRVVPVKLRYWLNGGSVGVYLVSRGRAGTTEVDLMNSVAELSGGRLRSIFFPTSGATFAPLAFLRAWMRRGAAAILTYNPQRLVSGSQVPDAWHHEVVAAVDATAVVLGSDGSRLGAAHLKRVLDSERLMLVRCADIAAILDSGQPGVENMAPVFEASSLETPNWISLNVPGQVAAVMRQQSRQSKSDHPPLLSHIVIPVEYRAGITLYAHADAPLWPELQAAQLRLSRPSENFKD